jgi:hypothetical protein
MKWFRIGLEVVGALSLVAILVVVILSLHDMYSEKINAASRKDVALVLSGSGISTKQEYRVIASYQSSRSFTGDHLDLFCIQLTKFEQAGPQQTGWHDGPETDPLLVQALQLGADGAHDHADCFPTAVEANSGSMRINFQSVMLYDRQPIAANIILYAPQSKRLYYVSYKN